MPPIPAVIEGIPGLDPNVDPAAYIGLPAGSMPNPQLLVAPSYPVDSGSAVDPYSASTAAATAEARRVAGVRSGLGTSQGSLEAGARTQGRDVGNIYDVRTRDFLSGLQEGQDTINTGRATNALNLRRGMATIASGVRQGLRSGGVTLANMGALDSGAAEALARAWARVGGQQTGDVRGQAAGVETGLDTQQGTLNRNRDDTLYGLDQYRTTEVDRIGAKLLSDLQALEASGASQGVSGAVDLGLRDRVINDAVARLNAIDAMRSDRLAGIHSLTPEEIAARAVSMEEAGMAGGNPFSVEGPAITTPRGIGADISQLPIFVRRRQQTA